MRLVTTQTVTTIKYDISNTNKWSNFHGRKCNLSSAEFLCTSLFAVRMPLSSQIGFSKSGGGSQISSI